MKRLGFVRLILSLVFIVSVLPAAAQDDRVLTASQKLGASDAALNARFGASIAIDGDTAVIGAPSAQGIGAAYVFSRMGDSWSEVAILRADNGEPGDRFGADVAIDRDTIVIGAPGDDDAGGNAGAAYVFSASASGWLLTAKLRPSATGDTFFGASVSVYGSRIAVGAPFTSSGTVNSGAAYVFEGETAGWQEAVRFSTDASGAVLSDLFGWDVAIDNETLVVGAYLGNFVQVYERTLSGWQASVATRVRGGDSRIGDRFGYAVSIDGDRMVVGAVHDDDAGVNAGSAYVFVRIDGIWLQEAKLAPSRPAPLEGSNFGWSVWLDGTAIAVGAPHSKGLFNLEEPGAVYAYHFGSGAWQETALIGAGDAAAADQLGTSVVISGNAILAGAPDHGTDAGAVYGASAFAVSVNTPALAVDDVAVTVQEVAVAVNAPVELSPPIEALPTVNPPELTAEPSGATIVDVAIAANTEGNLAGQYDTFITAILTVDVALLSTLVGSGQFTVFAPTDDAFFAALGLTPETVADYDQAALTHILLYHVASERRDSNTVLSSERIDMLNGAFLLQSGGSLIDNQGRTARLITTDLQAANGVIHAIDQVLLP
jgi:uncharacterized surface protein with fasciclin (FAS1) repeats